MIGGSSVIGEFYRGCARDAADGPAPTRFDGEMGATVEAPSLT